MQCILTFFFIIYSNSKFSFILFRYNLKLTIERVRKEKEEEETKKYHIAGNINESFDMFGYDVELPPIVDGLFYFCLNFCLNFSTFFIHCLYIFLYIFL